MSLWTAVRAVLSLLAGSVAVGSTMTAGCDDSEGPAWERCRSLFGNASYEWRGGLWWVPIAIGVVAGALVWVALGAGRTIWVEGRARIEMTGDV